MYTSTNVSNIISEKQKAFIARMLPITTYLDLVIIVGNNAPKQPKDIIINPTNISNSLQCQFNTPKSMLIVDAVKQNEHTNVTNNNMPVPKTTSTEYLEYNLTPSHTNRNRPCKPYTKGPCLK